MATGKRRLPKITFNSPVVLCFVFICVGVQVASTLTGGITTQVFFTAKPGPWTDPLTYLCLVTHIFGHAGWDHLIGNMSYILLLGPLLEEKYGSGRLIGIILASALAASFANVFLMHSGVVGASGVVFTFILLSSVTGLREGELQIYGVFFIRGNVSYIGHIAGGVVGAIVGFLLPVNEKKSTSGYGLLGH